MYPIKVIHFATVRIIVLLPANKSNDNDSLPFPSLVYGNARRASLALTPRFLQRCALYFFIHRCLDEDHPHQYDNVQDAQIVIH